MIVETIIVCATAYGIFGSYFNALAELLSEQAREKQIHNDMKEIE